VSVAARIVIIGGGVIGCAIAYHLAQAGERDVVVLEKAELTHGSTWHAAGLVGQLRSKRNLTRLMQDSVAVLDRLEAESGEAIGWHKTGSIRIASSPERMLEIRRALGQARAFGLEAHEISAAEAKERFPWMTTEGVVGAAWIPSDGHVDPYGLTRAFAAVARRHGISFRERVRVTGFAIDGRRIRRVLTDQGEIGCEVVVNAAGIWAKRVGEMAGVRIAAGAVEHQYMVTEKAIDLPPGVPTFRDPDRIFYLKPDIGAFAVGGWEKGAPACWPEGVPFEFGRELFAPDMDRFLPIAEAAAERLPVLNEVGIRTVINGPIPVSADGEPVMGPAPELDNLFVACGFTAGIAAAGGAGAAMARWIQDGDPGMDLWPFDIRRFHGLEANRTTLAARTSEAYGNYYTIHWPGEEPQSARGLRRSPLHDRLAARGAVFGTKALWERPLFFAQGSDGSAPPRRFTAPPPWHGLVAAEHRAVREAVGLVDLTSFTKLEVTGRDALGCLQRLAANDLDRPDGTCVYTQLLNDRGGIEADLVVMRLAADRFYIVTGSGFGVRDAGWIRAGLEGDARLREVTAERAVLGLFGPRARVLLARVTGDDVSDAAFPHLAVREIEIGGALVRAARVSYVGELGFELHVPVEQAVHVEGRLREAGADLGLADVGYRAVETLRLEKGHVYWSAEIGPDVDPLSAGLGFAIAWDKGPFRGRDALARIRESGAPRRLVTLAHDGFAPWVGGEVVLHAGRPVATTTSAGYGHTVGRTIAFAHLPTALVPSDGLTVEAYGEAYPAELAPRALWDPRGLRLKG
jgi:4-methylaminobutanoate oxidase (formaldehyde-forming)